MRTGAISLRGRAFLAAVAALTACGPKATTCPEVWNRWGTFGSATIENRALVMEAPATPSRGTDLSYRHDALTGDFTIDITFDSFATDDGAFGAELTNGAGLEMNALIGNGYIVADQFSEDGSTHDKRDVSATSGTIRFTRSGSRITASIAAGDQQATWTMDVDTKPVSLVLYIIPSDLTAHTSVRVTNVSAKNTGDGFQGDTFDCNSLQP